MQDNRDIFYLLHIVDHIEQINKVSNKIKNFEKFRTDRLVQDAVLFNFLQIGENVKSLSQSLRKKYSKVPFQKVAGFRDVIVHGYSNLKYKAIWEYIHTDLPSFYGDIWIILENEYPEKFMTPNEETIKAIKEADDISKGKIKGKTYKSLSDLKKDLNL